MFLFNKGRYYFYYYKSKRFGTFSMHAPYYLLSYILFEILLLFFNLVFFHDCAIFLAKLNDNEINFVDQKIKLKGKDQNRKNTINWLWF